MGLSNDDFRAMYLRRGGNADVPDHPVEENEDPIQDESQPAHPVPEDESDWSTLVLTRGQLSMQPHLLQNIINQSAEQFRNVNLSECRHYVSDAHIVALAQGCPDLSSLDLRDTEVSDVSLKAIGDGCAHLKELNIDHCTSITDAAILDLAAGCRELVSLSCLGCESLTEEGLLRLEPQCILLDVNGILQVIHIDIVNRLVPLIDLYRFEILL